MQCNVWNLCAVCKTCMSMHACLGFMIAKTCMHSIYAICVRKFNVVCNLINVCIWMYVCMHMHTRNIFIVRMVCVYYIFYECKDCIVYTIYILLFKYGMYVCMFAMWVMYLLCVWYTNIVSSNVCMHCLDAM